MFYIIIFLVIFVFSIVRNYKNATHITSEHIVVFVGGVGAGKTFKAVDCLVARYGNLMFRYRLRNVPFFKKWSIKNKPEVYSTIPIRFRKGFKYVYSKVMTADHWKMTVKLPENVLLLWDEFGQIASQYDYDNPYVQINVQTLVRFFRHFTNGYIYITDQSAQNIAVQIRRRFNVVYNVSDFRRYHFLGVIPLPFYKVNVSKLQVSEDNIQNSNILHNESNDESIDFFFGYLPFSKRKRTYESRCYKYAYNYGFVKNTSSDSFSNLYTRYLPDLSCTDQARKFFRSTSYKLPSGILSPINTYEELHPLPPDASKKQVSSYKKIASKYNKSVFVEDINE